MARVTVVINDQAENALFVTIESDPPLPLTATGELDVDSDELTPAMAAAVEAMRHVGDLGSDYSELGLRTPPE